MPYYRRSKIIKNSISTLHEGLFVQNLTKKVSRIDLFVMVNNNTEKGNVAEFIRIARLHNAQLVSRLTLELVTAVRIVSTSLQRPLFHSNHNLQVDKITAMIYIYMDEEKVQREFRTRIRTVTVSANNRD